MMKKRCCVLLAAAMLGAAGCGAAQTPAPQAPSAPDTAKSPEQLLNERYAEPVRVKIVLGYTEPANPNAPKDLTPENSTTVKMMKEKFNIDLEYSWIVNSDQFDAKLGAELAAGNLPDILQVPPTRFEDLYSQGALGDLTDTFAAYRNDTLDKVFAENVRVVGQREGRQYGLPYSIDPSMSAPLLFYRQDMLQTAGVTELPATVAELEQVMAALAAANLNASRKVGDPVLAAGNEAIAGGLAGFAPIQNAYGAWPSGWYDDGNGTLQSPAVQPAWKDALTKLNQWYNKGYIAKDFAADTEAVSAIVGSKYPIMGGSGNWWTPNYPLNQNFANDPSAQWVVGPALTADGGTPNFYTARYGVQNLMVVSRDFAHPEALLKMINYNIDWQSVQESPDAQNAMTPAEKLEYNGYVYEWLPYATHTPTMFFENYDFFNGLEQQGTTVFDASRALKNADFWNLYNHWLNYKKDPKDATAWGWVYSRAAAEGSIGAVYKLMGNSNRVYDEVYITTPAMVKKQGELDKLRDTAFLSMIMGETPISDFEKYTEQWYSLGGREIQDEVNAWYSK
jgi:ABC-type glycerol-3-phosphate transport system substrate-binding protein